MVVLSRTAEMASAASREGILDGAAAIELCPIDPPTAAGYLSRPSLTPAPGWRDLIDRVLSPDSTLAEALNNPLSLTLVKDTYRAGEDIRKLLDFCDAAQRHAHGSLVSLTSLITFWTGLYLSLTHRGPAENHPSTTFK